MSARTMDREKALQIIWDRCQHSKETEKALEVLKEERPHGKWIDRSDDGRIRCPFWERYECSKCGAKSENTNFCPKCGADMRKEGEANDQL